MSHEVFELSGLHGAAAIFVQGAERQSHLVVMMLNFFLHGCYTASNICGRFCKYAILLYRQACQNHDPSNDNISHRFFIVGGVHLVAHHVTELRKLDLTRAIRVVLQGK